MDKEWEQRRDRQRAFVFSLLLEFKEHGINPFHSTNLHKVFKKYLEMLEEAGVDTRSLRFYDNRVSGHYTQLHEALIWAITWGYIYFLTNDGPYLRFNNAFDEIIISRNEVLSPEELEAIKKVAPGIRHEYQAETW